MSDPISAVTGAVGSVVGGLLGSSSSSKQASRNRAEARRQFNEQMAFSKAVDKRNYEYLLNQHAHTVEDMKRAGLNPLLAAGATNSAPHSSGSGASPTASMSAENMGANVSAMVGHGIDAAMKVAQAKLLRAQSDNLDANTASTVQQTEFFSGVKDLKVSEIRSALQTQAVTRQQMNSNISKQQAEIRKIGQDIRHQDEKHELQQSVLKQQIALAEHDLNVIAGRRLPSGSYKNLLGTLYALAGKEGDAFASEAFNFVKEFGRIVHEAPRNINDYLNDKVISVFNDVKDTIIDIIGSHDFLYGTHGKKVIDELRRIDAKNKNMFYGGDRK